MNGSRRFRLIIVAFLIVAASGSYGAYWWIYLRGTVSTDDAYVDARIITISSRLLGRVESVAFNEGDLVRAGDVLVTLVPDKLAMAVAEEQAEVDRAIAAVNRLKGPRQETIDVAKAEIQVRKVAALKALDDFRRAQKLALAKAISEADLDRLRSDVHLARAALEVSRKNFVLLLAGGSEDQVDLAEAELNMVRARLDQAKIDLDDAVLYSPVDGVVARRTVDPGEVVDAGQGLFQIVEIGKTWVVANLEEQDISELREGQPVEITLDAFPGRILAGHVGAIYGATLSRFSLLSTTSASGNFIKVTQRVPVRIDWDQPHGLPLFPGLNAVIRIRLNHQEPEESPPEP